MHLLPNRLEKASTIHNGRNEGTIYRQWFVILEVAFMACLTVLYITKYKSSSILTMVACTILQLIPFENVKKYITVLFSDIFCSVWYTSFHYGIITYFNKRQNKFYFDDDAILELYPLKMLKNIKIFYLQMMYWDFDRLVNNSFWYI